MFDLKRIFSPDGACADVLPGWRARPQQLAMAEAVEQAIADNSVLLAEAGTGTGKTLAYLIPALLSGRKGGDFHRHQGAAGPAVSPRSAGRAPRAQVAGQGGPAERPCQLRLPPSPANAISPTAALPIATIRSGWPKSPALPKPVPAATAPRPKAFPKTPPPGITPCPAATPASAANAATTRNASSWPRARPRSTPKWSWSTIICSFADLWLKDEGVAELLPACNTVILDEAHQLAETAAQFFGETLSTAQLIELAGDTKRLAAVKAGDFPALRQSAEDLTKATRDLRLAFPQNPVKSTLAELTRYDKWPDALKT